MKDLIAPPLLQKTKLPKRELCQVAAYLGEYRDITILTTGGATHYVTEEIIETGEKAVYKFHSRNKAIEIAERLAG